MRIMTLVLLAAVFVSAGACGAGDNTARDPGGATTARTGELPETGSIPKGEYATEEFEPAFTFRIEERGWNVLLPEDQDGLSIFTKSSSLAFLSVRRAFDPDELGRETLQPAPEDLVAWLERHPWLDASAPRSASIGGVEGQQIDISAARLLKDSPDFCSGPCVPLFTIGRAQTEFWISLDETIRLVILEDVEGETITIAIDSSPDQFDNFVPRAEKILDSVEWKDEP